MSENIFSTNGASSANIDKSGVRVVVRIRPFSEREINLNTKSITTTDVTNPRILQIDTRPPKMFTFDNVASQEVDQAEMFEKCGRPIVESCLSGYNGTIFCYGQTGSGKTYTMTGVGDQGLKGLIPRILDDLFSNIRSNNSVRYTTTCSFLEIYNEKLSDLLQDSNVKQSLQLREDIKTGVYVEDLSQEVITCTQEAMGLLKKGINNRHVGATAMNEQSSRSHSVFTINISAKENCGGVIKQRTSRLNLIDLAGSERQQSTGAEGERLTEACSINKSLSALGKVIMSLVDKANGKNCHVHYRDSKLTFLLRDSLGGNSKTCVIANVSPALNSLSETLSTLQFAQRAKSIKNDAHVNEETSAQNVQVLHAVIQNLTRELAEVKQRTVLLSPDPKVNQLQFAKYNDKIAKLEQELIDTVSQLQVEIQTKIQLENKIREQEIIHTKVQEKLLNIQDLSRRVQSKINGKDNEQYTDEQFERDGQAISQALRGVLTPTNDVIQKLQEELDAYKQREFTSQKREELEMRMESLRQSETKSREMYEMLKTEKEALINEHSKQLEECILQTQSLLQEEHAQQITQLNSDHHIKIEQVTVQCEALLKEAEEQHHTDKEHILCKLKEHQTAVDLLEQSAVKYKSELDASQQSLIASQTTVATITQENSEFKSRNEQLTLQLESTIQEHEITKNNHATLLSELLTIRQEFQTLTESNACLQSRFDEFKSSSESALQESQNSNALLQERITLLEQVQQQNKEAIEKAQSIQQQFAQFTKDRKRMLEMERLAHSLQSDLDKKDKLLSTMERSVSQSAKKESEAKQAEAYIRNKYEEQTHVAITYKKKYDQLKEQAQQDMANRNREQEEFRKQQIAQYQNKFMELEKRVRSTEAINQHLTKRNAELESVNNGLVGHNNSRQKIHHYTRMKEENTKLHKELVEVKEDLRRVRNSSGGFDKENAQSGLEQSVVAKGGNHKRKVETLCDVLNGIIKKRKKMNNDDDQYFDDLLEIVNDNKLAYCN
ncbi:kinesin-like protein [Acrasis kona]|uniref:Kinesin-like protein n=1 Tax=Acrasis kona TaxID=1008807 RepID=A0AAW2YUB8_9EUKA